MNSILSLFLDNLNTVAICGLWTYGLLVFGIGFLLIDGVILFPRREPKSDKESEEQEWTKGIFEIKIGFVLVISSLISLLCSCHFV